MGNILINCNSQLLSEEDTYDYFGTQIQSILKFKLEFDRQYLECVIYQRKSYVNMILEIILLNLKKFKENYLTKIMNETIYESPLSISSFVSDRNKSQLPSNDNNKILLKENFEKFERILQIIIQMSPEELFREVKSLILNEFDKTTLEIQNYLEKHKNKNGTKLFTWISQSILYVLSWITFKLDIYSITVNCLVEKINKFFVDFIERYSNMLSDADNKPSSLLSNKYVIKNLNIIHRFIKLKKYFIKDFCQNKDSEFRYFENVNNEVNDKFKFSFNKFNSFGRYLFNNCLVLMNLEPGLPSNNRKISRSNLKNKFYYDIAELKNFTQKVRKKNLIMKLHTDPENQNSNKARRTSFLELQTSNSNSSLNNSNNLITLHHSGSNKHITKNELDVYFKLYFTFKLANWKYTSIQSENIVKNEICRICENSFPINDFVLHISFCKYQRLYMQKIINLNKDLKWAFEDLKAYEEKLKNDEDTKVKDIFFSPKSEFNRKFKTHLIEKTPNLSKNNKKKADNELLDILSNAIEKEKLMNFIDYEKQPYKLSQLVSLIHFTVLILNQNKNCNSFSQDLDGIFSKLFNILMKKMFVVENILTLQDNRERAKMKIKNFYFKKQVSISNTPLLKFLEGDGRDSLAKYTKINSNKIFNNFTKSPLKRKLNSSKKFLCMLDDTQTKFKKHTSNIRLSPKNNSNKINLSNLAPNDSSDKKTSNKNSPTMTSLLFPYKLEVQHCFQEAKNFNNPLGKYLPNSPYNNKNSSNNNFNQNLGGSSKLSPRNNKIKQIGKELKLIDEEFKTKKTLNLVNKPSNKKLSYQNEYLINDQKPELTEFKTSTENEFKIGDDKKGIDLGDIENSQKEFSNKDTTTNCKDTTVLSNNLPSLHTPSQNNMTENNNLLKSPLILGRLSYKYDYASNLNTNSIINFSNDELNIINSPCKISKTDIISKKNLTKSKFGNSAIPEE
jgi:hypothetical protein